MTGQLILPTQCDHITGLYISPFPEHGGIDRLVHASESVALDDEDRFNYCPCCGKGLKAGHPWKELA
jgi:hypothetical protein